MTFQIKSPFKNLWESKSLLNDSMLSLYHSSVLHNILEWKVLHGNMSFYKQPCKQCIHHLLVWGSFQTSIESLKVHNMFQLFWNSIEKGEKKNALERFSDVSIGSCPNQLFAWTLAGSIHLRWVIKRLILTCRRRDESSSLLLQVNEPFYDSPQMYRTSQSSFKELIWARPYWICA